MDAGHDRIPEDVEVPALARQFQELADQMFTRLPLYRRLAEGAAGEAGLLELDFRTGGACELAFFGLAPEAIGQGAGRWLMNRALELAWRDGVGRVHLHTCTLDSPQAMDFYRRSGFAAVRREVEVLRDPRLSGHLPEDAAPGVPILR